LLRCLIDKVVVHRSRPDQVRTRVVWKGGDTTAAELPVAVGSLAALGNRAELERRVLSLFEQGLDDGAIARQLTAEGHRSPMSPTELLPSTVQRIRLGHRRLIKPGQSHPRRVPGHLTVSQVATALDIPPHWLYDRIHKGVIAIVRDRATGLYLFPDKPHTLRQIERLRAGKLERLRFDTAP
jgi:hypothetical protein